MAQKSTSKQKHPWKFQGVPLHCGHCWLWMQAQLRRSNHKLRGEVEDWQDKFAQLSSLNDIFLHSNQSLTTKNSDSADHTPIAN
jgi:hypothetical protein